MKRKKKTAPCPYCGEEIDVHAKACPHCGSDERTGWSEDRYLDGISLPDDEEYEKVREKEFGGGGHGEKTPWKAITAAIALAAFAILALRISC